MTMPRNNHPPILYRVEFVCSKGQRREDVVWRKGKMKTHGHILAMQQQIERETGFVAVILLNWTILTPNDTTQGARAGVAPRPEKAVFGTPCPLVQPPRLLPFTQTEE